MISALFAAVLAATPAADLPPWRSTEVNSINRLPARSLIVPAESEEIALGIANGELPITASRWVKSLNGTWGFKWKANPGDDWAKEGEILVPGCWQLQGAYDPALYTNVPYPIGFDGTGDPMIEPPKHYTSYKMRNPVGLYRTTFDLPSGWSSRRTVLRFYGVSSAFYVRLNGEEIGYAEDSRLPSEFDITDQLNTFFENTLEVEVYKHCDGSYIEDQDFWRLSGIFRDVVLVSEHEDAPKDFVVETTLSDDFKHGRFVIRDEKGGELKVREVEEPKLWSAEYPHVYVTPFEHQWGWWPFDGTDHYAIPFGFRKVEIRDSVIYLNGKRVLFKGVNRHEMQPESGYAVTENGMRRDIARMKEFNVNAVRTCHYPDLAGWYDLTDREGLMVVCEANVEAHGVPDFYGAGSKHQLPKNPRFHDSIVERNERMVKFYRNHPSILIWSLGNESGDGPAMADAYKAIKAIDPTRPVQYEGAQDSDHSDVKCPMYHRPWVCEKYVANKPAKPLVLCEYTHAMGNSNGGVQKYWELAKKYPSFQGGFVWDFVDQALWKTDERGKYLAYGGDFGDKPNDDNFNCNGLFDALRNPHPGAYELKHSYQPIHVTDYDWKTGVAKVENANLFTKLDEFECKVTYLANGSPVSAAGLELPATAPGEAVTLSTSVTNCDSVIFQFLRDGDLVAWNQFSKPFRPLEVQPPPESALVKEHPFKFNFWRAPTDNDRGWNMPGVCKLWKQATEDQKLPDGVKSDLKVYKVGEGMYQVDWELEVPKGLPPIPRVGLTFAVPKAADGIVRWFGNGPWENYADRATAAFLAVHSAKVGLTTGLADQKSGTIRYLSGALNPDNYSEPGEQGYRTGTRALLYGKLEVQAINAPFGFNIWPYPQTMLEGKKHQWELKEAEEATVNIDAVQMGVGGDDSWGARPHDEFMPGAGTYRLSFWVKGL